MRSVDVNVLIYAHRSDAEGHEDYRTWLDGVRGDDEPLGISGLVLSGFLRVVTNPRIFPEPTPPGVALAYVEGVRSSPAVVTIEPGPRHWTIFTRLCRETGARANVVPDAYLAALAMEHGATWYSADRGFSRFPHLRYRHPLTGE